MKKYKYKVSLKELPEEFEMLYQDLYKNYIYDLEKIRNKIKWKKIIQYIFSPIFFIFMGLVKLGEPGDFIGGFLFICIVYIVCFFILEISFMGLDKYKREHRMMYKNKIIPKFVKLINNQLEFKSFDNELFKMRENYRVAGFDKEMFTSFKSNDYVEGFADDEIFIKMCDVNVQFYEDKDKRISKRFQGIFAHTKCGKDIGTEIKISKNKIKILEQARRVEMDSVEFEKYFDVYSQNKIEAMQLLTIDVMETLINFYKKYNLDFEIIFRNNTIYMRFFTGPMFEPQIFKNSMDKKTLAIYFCILKFIVDVSKNVNKALQEVEI